MFSCTVLLDTVAQNYTTLHGDLVSTQAVAEALEKNTCYVSSPNWGWGSAGNSSPCGKCLSPDSSPWKELPKTAAHKIPENPSPHKTPPREKERETMMNCTRNLQGSKNGILQHLSTRRFEFAIKNLRERNEL